MHGAEGSVIENLNGYPSTSFKVGLNKKCKYFPQVVFQNKDEGNSLSEENPWEIYPLINRFLFSALWRDCDRALYQFGFKTLSVSWNSFKFICSAPLCCEGFLPARVSEDLGANVFHHGGRIIGRQVNVVYAFSRSVSGI